MERGIAAILATDMVGFSRLVEADEAGTIARQRQYLDTLIRPAIEARGGRVVKLTGDGLLAAFTSVVDAVECAVGIQREMAKGEAERPPEQAMRYRMAVNLGDIIIDGDEVHGDEIYGDGVNIAARLERLAPPGGVVVSGTAYDHLKAKVDVGYEDLGEQRLKNIAEPVRVYRIVDGAAGVRVPARRRWGRVAAVAAVVGVVAVAGWLLVSPMLGPAPGSLAELKARPGLAVLPFDNLSADPEHDYFATGLTQEVTAQLGQFTNLRVIARNSASRFGGGNQDVRAVSEALGARYLVEGSVRRDSDRVRVSAQLIDGESGAQIWSATYDEALSARALFDIQDQLAASVASRIGGLGGVIRKSVAIPAAARPDDLDAYDCILLHYKFWDTFDHAVHAQARSCLQAAVARHPEFAFGWAELAYLYWTEHAYGVNPEPGSLDRAKVAAERAIALDPGIAEGYGALSQTFRSLKRADEAVAAAERAFAINPNNVGILGGAGCMLTFMGRLDRAAVFLDRARALDPYPPWWVPYCKAIWHVETGAPEAALELLDTVSGPDIWLLGFARIVALVELGRVEAAGEVFARLVEKKPDLAGAVSGYVEKNFWAVPETATRLIDAMRQAGMT